MVLDGVVRPEFLPADSMYARVGLERTDLLRDVVHNRAERRRLDVHGDAALPAGEPPVRRQRELRRHAVVRGADHRQPRVHRRASRHATPAARNRSTSASSSRTECRPGRPRRRTADTATFTPNDETLLMNPGDTIRIHMSDAPAPGGGRRLQGGHRRPDAAYERLHAGLCRQRLPEHLDRQLRGDSVQLPAGVLDGCSGQRHPWAALQTDISTEFETGHWESCTSLSDELNSQPARPGRHGRRLQRVRGSVRERRSAGQRVAGDR